MPQVAAVLAHDGDVGQAEGQGAQALGVFARQEHEGHEELVPRAEEGEDADGDQRGFGQRQHDVPEGPHLAGAVHQGRFVQSRWQRFEESRQDEDGEGIRRRCRRGAAPGGS